MQQGSIIKAERKSGLDVWEFRWREPGPDATVLPQDALTHAVLIAVTLCAGTEDDRAVS
jgi:hypothetical protein